MRATTSRAAAVILTAGVLTAAAAGAAERESYEQVVPFELGGTLTIANQNGSIVVRTWSESSVRIEAEKKAKSRDALDDIEIVVEGSGSSVQVETVHRRKRDRGSVKYTISVPAEANVEARTANGSVTIDGIHGRVDARSVNGSVKIENTVGAVDATTTNGSIRASYDRADEGTHRFHTTNGSVKVYLPSDAGGEFDAETVNGRVTIDFPTSLSRSSRRHMKGSFGGGGASFEIETVNGSVQILSN